MKIYYAIVALLLFSTINILSQSSDVIITANNLSQIEQLAMYRRGTIEEVAWSPDGKLLAAGGSAGGWIYDVGNMHNEPIYFSSFMRVNDLEFNRDGSRIISVGRSNSIYEWDAHTGEVIRAITPSVFDLPGISISFTLTAVTYSPDGEYIAASGHAYTVLLDSKTGDELKILLYGSQEISFSPDGKRIAIIQNGQMMVWNVNSWLYTNPFPAVPEHTINMQFLGRSTAWSSDSNRIFATGIQGGWVSEFDLTTGDIDSISPGGEVVATHGDLIATRSKQTANNDARVDIFEGDTFRLRDSIKDLQYVTDLSLNSSGDMLAIGQANGSIVLWDINEQRIFARTLPSGAHIAKLVLLKDRFLVSMETSMYEVNRLGDGGGCSETVLRLWDITNWQEVNSWSSVKGAFYFSCIILEPTADDEHIILSQNYQLLIFDPFTEEIVPISIPVELPYDILWDAKISADGQYMAAYLRRVIDPIIVVWDISEGFSKPTNPVIISTPEMQYVEDFVFTPDNTKLIVSSSGGSILLWDVSTGEQIREIDWSIPDWFAKVDLSFSPDGSTFVINAGGIHLLDTISFEEIRIITNQTTGTDWETIYGTRNDWFVTHAGRSSLFRFWNISNETFYKLPVVATDIVFTSDGRLAITGGSDGTIRVWGIP